MSDTQVIAALQRQAQQAEAERLRLVEEVARLRGIVSACEGVGVSVVALPDGRTAVNNARAMKAESACEWVPVGVRLPELKRDVLIRHYAFAHHQFSVAHREAVDWKDSNGEAIGSEDVTHWMPLPSPPEVK